MPSSELSAQGSPASGSLPPIAVIGFSLRFPGDAVSPESFWKMLLEARSASTPFPKDRLNIEAHYHPEKARLNAITVTGGHFITGDIAEFDAPFFSITAQEAEALDPQQRLIIETAYRALENAGLPMHKIAGSKTSVFSGSFTFDYTMLSLRDSEAPPKYQAMGTSATMLANRISWFYDLHGPSVNLDSACSSSMMAMDMACQSIWNGDSEMGIVGGSNLIYAPDFVRSLDNLGFLSADNRCFSFDHRANGYSRGDGFGVVIVKPLADAIRDGDTIRAVIRSTSSNQDGKTPGITQPSPQAQEQLIRDTYRKAGLDLAATRYFEAHGTGTPVGDPIEARAIGSAFRGHSSPESPVYVGAVKSNIGHLEGASGIAGIIKSIMVLEKGIIPPNANFESLNPKIDADFLNLVFPTEAMPWPNDAPRRASVSSFGYGGSNCHVVLDDAYNFLRMHGLQGRHRTRPHPPSVEELRSAVLSITPNNMSNGEALNGASTETHDGHLNGGISTNSNHTNGTHTNGNYRNGETNETDIRINGMPKLNGIIAQMNGSEAFTTAKEDATLLVWSAHDESGIGRFAQSYEDHFSSMRIPDSEKTQYLTDLAYTLAERRTLLGWKGFSVVSSIDDLTSLSKNMSVPVRSLSTPGACFVFTGQGAQWFAMGRELIAKYPIYAAVLLDASEYLKTLGCSWDLFGEMIKPKSESKIDDPAFSQPCCTALQIALVDLLETFGITPVAVIGHSSGEIAAAYAAKGLSAQSALKVSYYRGLLSSGLGRSSATKGAMLSANLSPAQAGVYIERSNDANPGLRLDLACINSPSNVTISGDAEAVTALKEELDNEDIFARKLNVNVAYHSFQMQAVATEYEASIAPLDIPSDKGRVPVMIASTVTGDFINPAEFLDPRYWVKNMTSTVRFAEALAKLCSRSKSKRRKKLDLAHRKELSFQLLVEIGPHSALKAPCKEILESQITYVSVLTRNQSAIKTLLTAVGRLYCLGHPLRLAVVNGLSTDIRSKANTSAHMLVDLPQYPFNHGQPFWFESRLSKNFRFRKHGRHDLLGIPDLDWNPFAAKWRHLVKVAEMPWVEDHKINNTVLYPATGMLVMAIEGVKQLAEPEREIIAFTIRNATFNSAINVPTDAAGMELQLFMTPQKDSDDRDGGSYDFQVCSYKDDKWFENCRGSIQIEYEPLSQTAVDQGKESGEWHALQRERYAVAAGNCSSQADTDVLYDHLKGCGYQYGPTFRALSAAAYNGGEVVADIKVFRWSEQETANVVQPHTVHPATFDAIFQMILTALTKGGTEMMATQVPSRLTHVWISNTGLNHPAAKSFKAYSKSSTVGLRNTTSDLVLFDKDVSRVLLELRGGETTAIGTLASSAQSSNSVSRIVHQVEWKPDLELLNHDEIRKYCVPKGPDPEEDVKFYTDCDFIVTGFLLRVAKGITDMGYQNLKPHLKMYVDWVRLQRDKFDSGELAFSDPKNKALLEDEPYFWATVDRIENHNMQGKMFATVGRNLLGCLRGEVDFLDLLFGGTLAKDHYTESWENAPGVKHFQTVLDALAHKNPNMRFLEVGAGTGGMTVQMLKTLGGGRGNDVPSMPRYSLYNFTDISRSFFGQAQETFGKYKRLDFNALNIEEDPEKQGFECGTYDIIVAAAVLHATTDLIKTLKNVRKLLKPGGKLCLSELTKPNLFRTAFVFGQLEGWWLSTEPYRKYGPCVNDEKWGELLLETGFSGLDLVLHDFQDENHCHEGGFIISTAVGGESKSGRRSSELRIVVDDKSEAQKQFAQELVEQLTPTVKVAASIETIESLARSGTGSDQTIVSLLELEQPLLYHLNAESFPPIHDLFVIAKSVVWVTGGGGSHPLPEFHLVDGFSRVFMSEDERRHVTTLALDRAGDDPIRQIQWTVKTLEAVMASQSGKVETDYTVFDDRPHIGRIVDSQPLNEHVHDLSQPQQRKELPFESGPPLKLDVETPGLLDSLRFVEDKAAAQPLQAHEVEIEIYAAGLSFKDVLIALGRIQQTEISGECAGIVHRVGSEVVQFQPGDRVLTCIVGAIATFARVDAKGVIKLPESMSYIDAAAIPISHVTAWHSLHEVARLRRGETVLIHSAAGGTGQAAIQVAQYLGAEIIATVGSDMKKQQLIEMYGIPTERIFESRDLSFTKGVMRTTGGKGVDVVLNSLSGDGLVASWECIAPYGRFLEIGKKDIYGHKKLPMYSFARNVSFCAVDAAAMSLERPDMSIAYLHTVLRMIQEGKLFPSQPLHVYGIDEVVAALRFLQSGKSTGKIVIDMHKDGAGPVPTVLDTRPTYSFDANATYIVAGGLGGLGRSILIWLVDRGARYIVVLSRSGAAAPIAQELITTLHQRGANISAVPCNVGDRNALAATLGNISRTMAPIKGCITGAMVLKDAAFDTLTYTDWATTFSPKVDGSRNLHELLPQDLDFFIMLSSLSGVWGSKGQANYAAGNTYQDALARARVAAGQKATAIDIGIMLDVGAVSEHAQLRAHFAAKNFFRNVEEGDLIALLDYYCDPRRDISTPTAAQVLLGASIPNKYFQDRIDRNENIAAEAYWLNRPLFNHLARSDNLDEYLSGSESSGQDFAAVFGGTSSLEEAAAAVTTALVKKLSTTLFIPEEAIDANKSTLEYGLDSLVAVELRNWFAKNVQADVAIFDILGGSTIKALGATVASKSQFRRADWRD